MNPAHERGSIPATHIKLKRAYEPALDEDGPRILVDRLWPRGISKERAALTHWLKELAPSTELRQWFGHEPARWEEFRRRYKLELSAQEDLLGFVRDMARLETITLIYSTRDTEHNGAIVLRDVLLQGVTEKS